MAGDVAVVAAGDLHQAHAVFPGQVMEREGTMSVTDMER
jgi:hypothetical protein